MPADPTYQPQPGGGPDLVRWTVERGQRLVDAALEEHDRAWHTQALLLGDLPALASLRLTSYS